MRGLVYILLWVACVPGLTPGMVTAGSPRSMTFSEALSVALHQNPRLAAAAHDTAASRSRLRETRADLYPQLLASAGYTRHEEPNTILPIHEPGVFPPLDDDVYEGRLDLRYSLFDGGRRRARIHAEEAGAAAASARLDGTRVETVAAISRLFVESRRVEDGLALVSARLSTLRERHREIRELLGVGRVAEGELSLVEAALSEAWADSVATASRRQEIALYLGMWVGQDAPVLASTESQTASWIGVETLELSAGTESPATREAAAQVERADAQRRAARRAYWPELTAFALLQARSGDELDFSGEWAAGLAIQLPLFTGGKRRASSQAAAAALRTVQHRHAAALLEQRTSERLALSRWEASRSRHESLLAAAEAKHRAVRAQQELYAAGRLTLAQLLIQENELLALQLEAADLAHTARIALLDHQSAAGTLSPARAQIIVGEES